MLVAKRIVLYKGFRDVEGVEDGFYFVDGCQSRGGIVEGDSQGGKAFILVVFPNMQVFEMCQIANSTQFGVQKGSVEIRGSAIEEHKARFSEERKSRNGDENGEKERAEWISVKPASVLNEERRENYSDTAQSISEDVQKDALHQMRLLM